MRGAYAVLVAAGLALACGGVQQKLEDEAAEKAIEAAGGGDVEINGGDVSVKGTDGSQVAWGTSVALPADFPADAPKPSGCVLQMAASSPKSTGAPGTAVMTAWQCAGKAPQPVVDEMKSGFSSWKTTMEMADASGTMLGFTGADGVRTALVTVGSDGNGGTMVTMTVDSN